MSAGPAQPTTLIVNARVYDHDGDTNTPAFADILIEGGRICRVEPNLKPAFAAATTPLTIIDATDRLVLPGFVNAHYHSHDVLFKGCFEAIPLVIWQHHALPPAYPKRSKEEVRARTLLGAAECLLGGMTTVQDMLTIYPYDPEHLDVVLQAYIDVGIRVIFGIQFGDIPGIERVPFWQEIIPRNLHRYLAAAVEPFGADNPVDIVAAEHARLKNRHERIHWALAPTSPEYCSPNALERIAALSHERDLPVYTHIYETKTMALSGRIYMPEHGGSQVQYLKDVGLLNSKVSLAHSIWILPDEIELIADHGANVVLNPVGNLKTKSGIPPIREFLQASINTAIGCDNSSCSDAQNMFQAMKMFTCLAAVTDFDSGPPTAADAIRCATLSGARSAGLAAELGAVKPGMKADLTILDLRNLSFVPLNSAARQVVFTESGTSVDVVMVDGQIVVKDGRLSSISEAEIRDAVEIVLPGLRADAEVVRQRMSQLYPYLMEAWLRSAAQDLGVNRYVGE